MAVFYWFGIGEAREFLLICVDRMLVAVKLAVVLLGFSALLATLLAPIDVVAFSLDAQSQVGNRNGQSLDGYSPLSARVSLDQAKEFLGKNAVESECPMGEERAQCLTYLQYGPVVTFIVRHYFIGERNQFAIVSAVASGIGTPGLWTPIERCDAVAKFTVAALVSLHGRPDETPWAEHYSFDPGTVPEFPPGWSNRPYEVKVARFTFPLGGEITFEYIELPRTSCMVRAIYNWAPW